MSRPWRQALAWLGLLLTLWVLAFTSEIGAAVATWSTSTAYNHCWLVLPLAAWLGWVRRARLHGLVPRPVSLAALPALGLGIAWLAAERLGIMEGRQLAALGILLTLVVAVLGTGICRAMAAPLLYLVFLVPFGAFLVPALQGVTAWMIVAGLQLLGIPHFADALTIEIPAGIFLVAEACAGLRFIIASLAFGALYALVMFRSPGRRLLVMGLALLVPVLANGLRALGIVLLGHYLGSAEAGAADHLIYGWVFFSAVILLLTLAGLPFRQDGRVFAPAPAQPPLPGARGPASAALLAAALGLAMPAGVLLLSAQGMPASRQAMRLLPPAGCMAMADGSLRCGDQVLRGEILAFPSRTTWSAVVAQRQRVSGLDDEAMTYRNPQGWQGRQSAAGGTVLVATWLGGRRAGDGFASRATQGWNSLFGGQGRPVVASLTLQPLTAPSADPSSARQRRVLLDSVAEGLSGAAEQHIKALSER